MPYKTLIGCVLQKSCVERIVLEQSSHERDFQYGIYRQLVDEFRDVVVGFGIVESLLHVDFGIVLVNFHLAHELATQFDARADAVFCYQTAEAQPYIGSDAVHPDVSGDVVVVVELHIIVRELCTDLVEDLLLVVVGDICPVLSVNIVAWVVDEIFKLVAVTAHLGNLLAAYGDTCRNEELAVAAEGVAVSLNVKSGARQVALYVYRRRRIGYRVGVSLIGYRDFLLVDAHVTFNQVLKTRHYVHTSLKLQIVGQCGCHTDAYALRAYASVEGKVVECSSLKLVISLCCYARCRRKEKQN